MRHKHADLIIAWANGAEIQVNAHKGHNGWKDCGALGPEWHQGNEYRIKPQPEPDVVFYGRLDGTGADILTYVRGPFDNLKATFDGETGKLKAVEILNQEAP
jgi:hypothetical protein